MEQSLLSRITNKETRDEWSELLGRYPDKKSALIQILHNAQRKVGYISEDVMLMIADFLDIRPVEVYETASFYTMFNLKKVGKYHIQVCKNISCSLLGAKSIMDHLSARLNIQIGETTSDGMFTLGVAECLASCGTAPMMQINDDYYENLTAEMIDKIISDLRSKA